MHVDRLESKGRPLLLKSKVISQMNHHQNKLQNYNRDQIKLQEYKVNFSLMEMPNCENTTYLRPRIENPLFTNVIILPNRRNIHVFRAKL